MELAVWLVSKIDFAQESAELLKLGLLVNQLLELTPHQLCPLFFKTKASTVPAGNSIPNRVELLHRHNHEVRAKKGLKPAIPDWM
jgi:hypothetical protein